ncbi:hypothetical protein RQP46_009005 [Phenoliferia psychrophenolica]
MAPATVARISASYLTTPGLPRLVDFATPESKGLHLFYTTIGLSPRLVVPGLDIPACSRKTLPRFGPFEHRPAAPHVEYILHRQPVETLVESLREGEVSAIVERMGWPIEGMSIDDKRALLHARSPADFAAFLAFQHIVEDEEMACSWLDTCVEDQPSYEAKLVGTIAYGAMLSLAEEVVAYHHSWASLKRAVEWAEPCLKMRRLVSSLSNSLGGLFGCSHAITKTPTTTPPRVPDTPAMALLRQLSASSRENVPASRSES